MTFGSRLTSLGGIRKEVQDDTTIQPISITPTLTTGNESGCTDCADKKTVSKSPQAFSIDQPEYAVSPAEQGFDTVKRNHQLGSFIPIVVLALIALLLNK